MKIILTIVLALFITSLIGYIGAVIIESIPDYIKTIFGIGFSIWVWYMMYKEHSI